MIIYWLVRDINANQQHTQFQNSEEMNFIILPKLFGVEDATAYLNITGTDQISQTSEKTNLNMTDTFSYYVGSPANKQNGIFCDMKKLSLKCQVWANYAIVSNEERKKMACAPRDMLIEQVQQTPAVDFNIRNQPESRWWPNNISKLVGGSGKQPTVEQTPEGSVFGSHPTASASTVPDNNVPNGEQNWPSKNFIAQQPSGQGLCTGISDPSTAPVNTEIFNSHAHDYKWTTTYDPARDDGCESSTDEVVRINLKYAYSVKALFFAAKNVTAKNIHSNYTIGFPVLQASSTDQVTLDGPVFSKDLWSDNFDKTWAADAATSTDDILQSDLRMYRPNGAGKIDKYIGKIQPITQSIMICKNAFDPIERASLLYETTPRLGLLDASYYSLMQPYYHAPSMPGSSSAPVFTPSGYHMYSYSLEFACLDPLGSTNYGKLTNVSLDAVPIKLNSSNLAPELVYSVPNVSHETQANLRYVYGPINGPGLAGDGAKAMKNQSVLEVLINMAYQNIYSEEGYETINPMMMGADHSHRGSSRCTYLGKFSFVSTAINNNVLRISGGSIGFPVL